MREQVDALIAAEMRSLPRAAKMDRDAYLDQKYPLDILNSKSAMLRAEFERKSEGAGPLDVIDMSRYSTVDNELTGKESLEQLEHVANSKAAFCGHLENQLINLELERKFGENTLRLHSHIIEKDIDAIRMATRANREEIYEINKKRKLEQTEIGQYLREMEEKWGRLVNSKLQVELANQVIEKQLRSEQSS